MSKYYCLECDPGQKKTVVYKTGGLCPCSDEKGREVLLIEIPEEKIASVSVGNQKFEFSGKL